MPVMTGLTATAISATGRVAGVVRRRAGMGRGPVVAQVALASVGTSVPPWATARLDRAVKAAAGRVLPVPVDREVIFAAMIVAAARSSVTSGPRRCRK